MQEKDFEEMAEYLKALAHPTRLRIIDYLMKEKEMCVKLLWKELGLQQSNVSQHLSLLKSKGIITARRDGVMTCYSVVDPKAIDIVKILSEHFKILEKTEK